MVRSAQSWVSVGESLIIMLISHVLQGSVTQTQSNQCLHPVSQPNYREKSPVLVVPCDVTKGTELTPPSGQ